MDQSLQMLCVGYHIFLSWSAICVILPKISKYIYYRKTFRTFTWALVISSVLSIGMYANCKDEMSLCWFESKKIHLKTKIMNQIKKI